MMETIELRLPSGAAATIYAYGAHLTSWRTATGREWIFTSRQAVFEKGKAIRGGVPIIFPQFNEFGSGPRHGFARTSLWALETPATVLKESALKKSVVKESAEKECAQCSFILTSSEDTQALWPHKFFARYTITLHDQDITLALHVKNIDDEIYPFTAALHSYFSISHLNQISIAGLAGYNYWDNDGSAFDKRFSDRRNTLSLNDAFDRVYFNVNKPLTLDDRGNSLTISQTGFRDVVIWNPGREAAAAIHDLADDEYQHMLCIEAAAIDKPIVLKPGEEWEGKQILQASRA